MAINIENETIVSLTEATKVLPPRNGRRVAISTMWRWCRKGLRGVRLEYVRMGRNIATSREALNRFFNALAAADPIPKPAPREEPAHSLAPTPRSRQRMLDEARRIAQEAGF